MPSRHVVRVVRGLGFALVLAVSAQAGARPVAPAPANAGSPEPSVGVDRVAHRVLVSNDNQDLPYLIIDKANAAVWVFDGKGRLQGTGAALLGMAPGDRVAGDIGDRKLAAIGPADRVTPAGRFHAYLDRDVDDKEILLIDYGASLALHPVVKGTPAENRAGRLASVTSDDNRITFGCVNVPLAFYRDVVQPAFANTHGYVYILPETASVDALFGSAGAP